MNQASKEDAMDDLEDGEIESEDDNNSSELPKDTSNTTENTVNLPKLSPLPSPELTENIAVKSSRSLSSKKDKKSKRPDIRPDDDWMGNVENAIAMALKKDGIEPLLPKLHKSEEHTKLEENKITELRCSKSKKRKRRDYEKGLRKKLKVAEEEAKRNETDEIDEYEMLCIRGGSPPPQSATPMSSNVIILDDEPFYNSDDSYSSYDSYESTEHRRSTYEERRQRRSKDLRSGSRKGGREKRRRDDSDNDDRSENRGPRKLELCKFYLMECCAKRDKCLYMHSDFPCKYYYLGMKNHNNNTCKFSHGKPLSDQLRNILLKHLETAPKEILGDFPRISRENAVKMLNLQQQKLLKEHGMDVPAAPVVNASKLPSLMELITKQPQTKNTEKDKNEITTTTKSDKPRKTRWCDPTSSQQHQQYLHHDQHLQQAPLKQPQQTQSQAHNKSTSASSAGGGGSGDSASYLSLKNLTGVITIDQINSLAEIGIENLDQINQLTVAQLNQFGLSITQIHEIQLNALNIQKLGLNTRTNVPISHISIKKNTQSSAHKGKDEDIKKLATSFYNEFGSGGRDLDMRITPVTLTSKIADVSSISLSGTLDVDMRILSPLITANDNLSTIKHTILSVTSDQSTLMPSITTTNTTSITGDLSLATNQQPSIIDYAKYINKTQAEQPKLDYSQYLKDSNLDLEKTDLEDTLNEGVDESGDDTSNLLVIEDEIPLQIDESWCSSGDESSPKNGDDDQEMDISDSDNVSEETAVTVVKNPPLQPLPAVYDPSSIFPTTIMNKIDISSSVIQYLNSSSGMDESTEMKIDSELKRPTEGNDDKHETTFVVSKTKVSLVCRDPRKATSPVNELTRQTSKIESSDQRFEYFTRQLPETSHPTPQALDIKTTIKKHTSIYEYINSPTNDEEIVNTKDKDMRLSSLFFESDFAKGDIDLRLPFKPVMANFIPAKEIDASITSNLPIAYKVKEVDVPKPDYSEIRRNIPLFDEILDPRLRRILSLRESTNDDKPTIAATTAVSNKQSETIAEVCIPRVDPRRKNKDSKPTVHSHSSNLDIQCVLQKSIWYKDLSSKQKIMVNQQLALVSTELKKFHQDQSPEKVFDLTFVMQNPLLQQVLTNLAIYIDENGQFVQLPQPPPPPPPTTTLSSNDFVHQQHPPNMLNHGGDMMVMPPMALGNMEFIRQPIAPNMMSSPRFMGPPGPMMFGGGGGGGGGGGVGGGGVGGKHFGDIRPGILGVAPGIPFNMYENQDDVNYSQYDDCGNKGGGGGGGNNNPNGPMFDPTMVGGNYDNSYNHNFQNSGNPYENNSGGGGSGYFGRNQNDERGGGNRGAKMFRCGGIGGGGVGGGGRQNNVGGNDRWGAAGGNRNNSGGINSGNSRGHMPRRNNYDNRDRNMRRDKPKH